jgi:hypothetical protein
VDRAAQFAIAAQTTARPRFAVHAAIAGWLAVIVYAVGMAYVEAAAVLYLRTIYGGIDPVGTRTTVFDPVPDFVWVEIGREAATMVMLGAIGWLAGRGFAGRLGGFALAFGVWDIFYYAFLWKFAAWPHSLLAPDVLFLIPLPWWGPVLAPCLVAAVISVAGGAAMARELGDGVPRPTRGAVLSVVGGALLCLVAFMADSLRALVGNGLESAYYARGGPFAWPLFVVGLALGVLGLWRMLASAPSNTRVSRSSSDRSTSGR